MEVVSVKASNQEISALAGQWLDAVDKIPMEFCTLRLVVRQQSQKLLDFINKHSDVMSCGTVCASMSIDELLQYSKSYATVVHSLPDEVKNVFNKEFEEFWGAFCSRMKL